MSNPTKLDPGSEAVLRGFQPLRINAPLGPEPGVLDHALANPEPQRITLNNFARPLGKVGRKQQHLSTQTNAQSYE